MPIHVYSIFFFISTLQKSGVKVRDNLFFSVFYDKSILNTFFCLMPNFFTSRKTNLAVKYLFCFHTNISNHCLLFSSSGSLYKLHNHRWETKPHLFSSQWTLSDLIVDFQFFFRLTFSKSVCKWFCSLLSSKFLVLLSRTARKCKFYLSFVITSIDVWLRDSRETSSTIRILNCAYEVLLTM